MKKLIIFDLDGTLLDTISDLGTAVNYALERNAFPTHPLSVYNMMVGNGVRRLIQRAIPSECRSEEIVDRLLVDFREYYDEHLCDNTKPYPGIVPLLEELRSKDVALAVASNKYDSAVKKLIEHFFPEQDFASVCGNIEGYPPKPDPSVIFRVLTECPTPKAEVLYVGDSAIDVETARRACVDSVAVGWGFRPIHELTSANPTHLITAPVDLLGLLGQPIRK